MAGTLLALAIPGLLHAQGAAEGAALRLELESATWSARAAAQAGDFEAFMRVYEPAKGRTLVREQWPAAREVILAELARPPGAGFLRAVRKGWWAGYYFREEDAVGASVTMHRYHMGPLGWQVRGETVSEPFAKGATPAESVANARREIDSNPAFALPDQ